MQDATLLTFLLFLEFFGDRATIPAAVAGAPAARILQSSSAPDRLEALQFSTSKSAPKNSSGCCCRPDCVHYESIPRKRFPGIVGAVSAGARASLARSADAGGSQVRKHTVITLPLQLLALVVCVREGKKCLLNKPPVNRGTASIPLLCLL